MRFIHMADMHFDAPFARLSSKGKLGDKRRLEQRAAFSKMIEYIKKEEISFLFISGDLYEHEYVRKSTIEFIKWAAGYDSGLLTGRSLPKHEEWLLSIPCDVLRITNLDFEESVTAVIDAIKK